MEIKYLNLVKRNEIMEEKRNTLREKYKISKEIYRKGYMNFLDYIKIKEKYEEAEEKFLKIKNEINAFKYEVKFNSLN